MKIEKNIVLPKFRTVLQPSKEKILEMNIHDYFYDLIDHKGYCRKNYENLLDYYGDMLDEGIVSQYKLNPNVNYVLENLNTHDSNKLINNLKSAFRNVNIEDYSLSDSDRRYIGLRIHDTNNHSKDVVESRLFKHICDFFGYTISKAVTQGYFTDVKLEPIYSKDANDLVYNECFGKIYHITTKENADRIMKTGLRIRNGNDNNQYRVFPKRIYFIAIPPRKQKIETREEIKLALDLYLSKNEKEKGYCILKADVYGTNIDFYLDSVSDDDSIYFSTENRAVYCYTNIPPQMLSVVYDSTQK